MNIILDSAAILSGKINSVPENVRMLMTDLVRSEIRKGNPQKRMESLIDAGLKITNDYDIDAARERAAGTGDLDELSPADISVIALAISIEDPLVLTDDFRIQNVLKSLNIRFESAGEIGDRSIKQIWEWSYRCTGCGRYYNEKPEPECPICGHHIKKARKIS